MFITKGVERNNNIRNQVSRYIFCFLFTLISLQMMPIIKDNIYEEIRILNYAIYIIFGTTQLSLFKKFTQKKFNIYFILVLLYAIVLAVLAYLGNAEFSLIEMFLPFLIYMSSYNTYFNKKQLDNLLVWYIFLTVILGISSIFYYGQGIKVTEQYFLVAKNQIGPMLGYSTFMSMFFLIRKKNKKKIEVAFYFLSISSLLISILVIRNRSSIVAIFVTLLLFMLSKKKKKYTSIQYLIGLFSVALLMIIYNFGLFDKAIDFTMSSMFSSYNVNDLNSISAGRTDVYRDALSFVIAYPISGKINSTHVFTEIPHNYILNKWVNYGIVFSMPLIIFYLYLWNIVVTSILNKKSNSKITLPILILFFSLILSLLEYSYPYVPGTTQMIVWFLLGQFFNRKEKLDDESDD